MKHGNKKVFVSLGTRNAIISLRLIGWTQHEKKNSNEVREKEETEEKEGKKEKKKNKTK